MINQLFGYVLQGKGLYQVYQPWYSFSNYSGDASLFTASIGTNDIGRRALVPGL
jgi:hypothetical protein